MKPKFLILLFSLSCFCNCFSQDPFSKGTLGFTNRPWSYSNFKSVTNGNPTAYDIRIDPEYFVVNGVAVGLDLRVYGSSAKPLGAFYHSWQADLTLTYGRKITDRMNAYVKILAGPGHSNNGFDLSTLRNNPQRLAAKYFDLKALIGAPIALDGNGAAFFTPYISYDKLDTKTPHNILKDKTVAFGFKLETYIGKGGMANGKSRSALYEHAYLKGAHFLELNTMGSVSLNTRQQEQIGSTLQIGKQENKTINLVWGYNYFVIDDVAVGLNFYLNNYKSDYQGSTSPASIYTTFIIQPIITAQAPLEGAGHNLFLQAGYGFGSYKQPKKNLTELTVRIGYNLFLTKFLTLTPKIGYERAHGAVPSKVSGIPFTNSGIAAEMGVRAWLNFWKWK